MTAPGNSASSRDIAYYLHPYTNLKKHETAGPMIVTHGEGVRVFDDSGKEYIEAMAGLWNVSLGFHEPRLIEAARKQLETLPYYHTFAHKAHEPGIELAERLIKIAPVPMSKVFFASSGSEANDTAVKLVWFYNNALGRHKKKKIIARLEGYHGVTVASASLTGRPVNHRGFDLPIAGILHTANPHYYHGHEEGESEEAFATRMADALDKLIEDEGPETVAAFIAEPVMGAGGVITPPKTYFEKIQAVLSKHDVLFIADEVICGFGRTGNMFGSETYQLAPDILTGAKALSSGYMPISMMMINDKIYQAIARASDELGVFGHGYTYTGHPVCAAVAVETLKIYEERDIVGQVRRVAPRFQKRLHAFADHPFVGETRGVGLIGAVEVVADKRARRKFDPKAGVGIKIMKACEANGLIVRPIGESIAFTPPLVISEAEIDQLFDRFAKALDEVWAEVRGEGLASVA